MIQLQLASIEQERAEVGPMELELDLVLEMAKSVRVPMRHGSSRLCVWCEAKEMRVLQQSSNSDDDDLPLPS